ncbi:type VI secretion system baseplate subunit TssE [Aquabacterium sp.]|uniref:type VI secretion system baseplate subunit TssE n=1 Tax=Aquabacterium sp. TaxID=1872578 RepID=UPI002E3445DB|nr:type VI secretion system baseplate subunit TssE [Aquabacterium sp.]HEX5310450.1 type VI secretion system baseplate subunit TssE [Aquabacterium sp.]
MFALNLFEKLLDVDWDPRGHISIDQLKDSVARDVEAILNTRCGLTEVALSGFPAVQQSVLSFGLRDFVSLSLAKEGDRELICEDIRRALVKHEPRLSDVVVSVMARDDASQRLHFSIQALLITREANEMVSFDAILHPNNLRYQVSKTR